MNNTLRKLWILVSVLVATNVVTVLSAFYLLGRVDRAYSEIVDPSFLNLSIVRELTRQSVNLQRVVLNLLLVTDQAERGVLLERYAKMVQLNRDLLERAHQLEFQGVDDQLEQALGRAGKDYLELTARICRLVEAGQEAEARVILTSELRLKFEAFQSAQSNIAGSISEHALKTSSRLSTTVSGFRHFLMAVVSLPVLVLSLLGLLFLIFIVQMYRIIVRLQREP